jgi:transcriptional regulator with XRE-family HTH domain
MNRNESSFITDLIAEECERDPVFKVEYEAEKLMRHLISARIERNLTQGQVAEAMGIHQPAVVRIENKPETASFGRLLSYANVVGVVLTMPEFKRGTMEKPARSTQRRPHSAKMKKENQS